MLSGSSGRLKKLKQFALISVLAATLSACGAPQSAQTQGPQTPTGIAITPAKEVEPAVIVDDPEAGASELGDFDFYVLSLSWSPTYCLDEGDSADPAQCGPRRRLGFVVHGLWPQNEKGYPKDCDAGTPARASAKLGAQLIDSMLDVMPSRALIRHEWRSHGLCAGMTPEDYFAAVRKARSKVRIPAVFDAPSKAVMTNPIALESEFIKENSGLTASGVAVTCSGQRLREVRICLTKSLEFRSCSEVNARACDRDHITAPPSRGG